MGTRAFAPISDRLLPWCFRESSPSPAGRTSPPGSDVLYFAFVNYATLGYGDVVPVEHWRLLGPTTAMCGIVMFGWSTAVIFDVLRRALSALPEGPRADIRDR